MADYLGSLQPNLNPQFPKVKAPATQVTIDPIKTSWKCPLCNKSMPILFRECHVKLHAMFSCPLCLDFCSLCDFGPHMIDCMNIYTPDEFRCTICSNLVDSVGHIKTKHINSLVCLIPGCRRSFSPSAFGGHIKTCLKIFAKQSSALPPSTNKPRNILKQQIVECKAPLFKCIFCETCPSTEFLLRKHIEKVHIKHTCPLCKAREIHESNFNDHVTKCLKKSSNQQDNCPICGQHLANRIDHIHKTHSTLKITCPSCKEKFKCSLIAAHAVTCQKQSVPEQEASKRAETQFENVPSTRIEIPSAKFIQKPQLFAQNNSIKPLLLPNPLKTEPPKRVGASGKIQNTTVSIPTIKSSDPNQTSDLYHNKKQVSFQMSSQPSDLSDSEIELTSLFNDSD